MWEFNRDTAERDLTAHELLTILDITLSLTDGLTGAFKFQPHLLRHFRRVPLLRHFRRVPADKNNA